MKLHLDTCSPMCWGLPSPKEQPQFLTVQFYLYHALIPGIECLPRSERIFHPSFKVGKFLLHHTHCHQAQKCLGFGYDMPWPNLQLSVGNKKATATGNLLQPYEYSLDSEYQISSKREPEGPFTARRYWSILHLFPTSPLSRFLFLLLLLLSTSSSPYNSVGMFFIENPKHSRLYTHSCGEP